jgi:hypothetical protein
MATPPASIFQPWQIWWFWGHHGALVQGLFGSAKVGYRTAPGWVGPVSHPLILLAGTALTTTLWLSKLRRALPDRRLSEQAALLALALPLLLRCMLDTWDTAYYTLPFIFALLAWEARGPYLRPPILTLSSVGLVWLTFQWSPAHISPDAQAALFLSWSLPLAAFLGHALYVSERSLTDRRQLLRQAREPLVPALADEH